MVEILRTDAFAQWLDQLRDEIAQARIAMRIDRLGTGNPGDVKSVGGGVVEMRIDHGPGYRLYAARRGRSLIILLCGGDKSTQRRDIEAAKVLLRDIENGVIKWLN